MTDQRTVALIVIFALAVFVVLTLWFEYSMRTLRRKHLKEFREAFPGKCFVCGYWRYGLREGFVKSGEPVNRHFCIEQSREIGE